MTQQTDAVHDVQWRAEISGVIRARQAGAGAHRHTLHPAAPSDPAGSRSSQQRLHKLLPAPQSSSSGTLSHVVTAHAQRQANVQIKLVALSLALRGGRGSRGEPQVRMSW